jgi:hypothetical protein
MWAKPALDAVDPLAAEVLGNTGLGRSQREIVSQPVAPAAAARRSACAFAPCVAEEEACAWPALAAV